MIALIFHGLTIAAYGVAIVAAGVLAARALHRRLDGDPRVGLDLAAALTYVGLALALLPFAFPLFRPALDLCAAAGFGAVAIGGGLTLWQRRRLGRHA